MKKKITSCLTILTITTMLFAQSSTEKSAPLNEIKVNVAGAVFGIPEVDYERLLSGNTGVGVAFAYSTLKLEDLKIRSIILPFYRVYFGEKKGVGFFMEANMGVVTQNYQYSDRTYIYDETTGEKIATGYIDKKHSDWKTTVSPGAAIGLKLVAKNGFIGEIFLGGGRTYVTIYDKFYPRMGVSIGKSF